MGNWYTWGAATAGSSVNAVTTNAEAEDSICPKGWQLPYGGSKSAWGSTVSKSFGNLLRAYGQTSSGSETSAALTMNSLEFTYAGGYDFGNGRVYDVNGSGYYWSANANDNYGAYLMSHNSRSLVYPQLSNSRGYGRSVRCAVR